MKSSNQVFGLVCAGGGAHGAYQVGVLKFIHEKFCIEDQSPFKVFAGSSCGALNTTFYAAESHNAKEARLQLEELWKNFHIPSYYGSLFKNSLKRFLKHGLSKKQRESSHGFSLLDPYPLNDIVNKGLKRSHLEKALSEKSTLGVAIAASELLSGRTCWFMEGELAKEWKLTHSIGIDTQIHPVHLAASCSIPIFLPPVKIGKHFFLDGSVRLIRPLSAAISLGATHILSIATEKRESMELPEYNADLVKPKMSHVMRMLIAQLTKDASVDEAVQIELLNRYYTEKSKGNKVNGVSDELNLLDIETPDHYHKTNVCLFHPSKRIKQSPLFDTYESKNKPWKKTRFMFHTKFITELIDLGYEDAQSKKDELEEFFHQPKPSKIWSIFAKQN